LIETTEFTEDAEERDAEVHRDEMKRLAVLRRER
jgi:hypothetical protein